MQSQARTVEQYLADLPEDRRAAIAAVRDVILDNLDREYAEGMQYGMIGYYVPHSVFPPGYHCDPRQPLPFTCLASQKNHMAIYMMSVCGESEEGGRFRREWAKTGKKLDMGKSCIRFRKIEDLALDVIGAAIRRMPARAWIEFYQRTIAGRTPTPRAEISARVAARKSRKAAGTDAGKRRPHARRKSVGKAADRGKSAGGRTKPRAARGKRGARRAIKQGA